TLFRDFPTRLRRALKRTPARIFLTRNYRSTKSIVHFAARYGRLDPKFQEVRISDKPSIRPHAGAQEGVMALAMFRDNVDQLANDLGEFLNSVFRGNGAAVGDEKIVKGDGGDLGDAALLCFSPTEGDRLPGKLRSKLGSLNPPIGLFNPRGEALAEVSTICNFGGLVLECLDPD